MTYKIIETIHITREFLVEAEGQHQAIDKFTHETAKLLKEKEDHFYEVEEINEPEYNITRECDICQLLLHYEWDKDKGEHSLPRCSVDFRNGNTVRHPCPDYQQKSRIKEVK